MERPADLYSCKRICNVKMYFWSLQFCLHSPKLWFCLQHIRNCHCMTQILKRWNNIELIAVTTKIRARLLQKAFQSLFLLYSNQQLFFCLCNWLCFSTFSVYWIIPLWHSSSHPRHSVSGLLPAHPNQPMGIFKVSDLNFSSMSRSILLLWKMQEHVQIIVGELDLLVNTWKYTHKP